VWLWVVLALCVVLGLCVCGCGCSGGGCRGCHCGCVACACRHLSQLQWRPQLCQFAVPRQPQYTHTCTHIHTDICHKRARTHAPARSDAQAQTYMQALAHSKHIASRLTYFMTSGSGSLKGGNEGKRNALTKYMLPIARTECTL
jgi:hypothetical protein